MQQRANLDRQGQRWKLFTAKILFHKLNRKKANLRGKNAMKMQVSFTKSQSRLSIKHRVVKELCAVFLALASVSVQCLAEHHGPYSI